MKTTGVIAWVLLSLALLAGCGGRVLSEGEFTARLARELEAAGMGLKVVIVKDLELRTLRDGSTNSVFLDNAYTQYRGSPTEADWIIKAWVQPLLEMPDAADVLQRTNLVPVVKDAAFVREVVAGMLERGKETNKLGFVSRPLNPSLTVVYAHDSAHAVRYLQPADLATLGLEEGELHAVALENLRRILPAPRVEEISKGLHLVQADGTYESSLLLLTSWWETNRFDIQGEPVVALPRREVLMVAGSADAEALLRLRLLARRYYTEGPYELTDQLFVFRGKTFVPFQ